MDISKYFKELQRASNGLYRNFNSFLGASKGYAELLICSVELTDDFEVLFCDSMELWNGSLEFKSPFAEHRDIFKGIKSVCMDLWLGLKQGFCQYFPGGYSLSKFSEGILQCSGPEGASRIAKFLGAMFPLNGDKGAILDFFTICRNFFIKCNKK